MRFEVANAEILQTFLKKGTPGIAAFWHGRLLMMPWLESMHDYQGRKMSFLVSPHRDGQVIGRAVQKFGHYAILGSSSRGGVSAIHQMLKAQKEGYDLMVVPDGPRGPRYRVQIGVIELAKLTGNPIIPLTFGASKRKLMGTWDQFLIPYPFSRGVFIWGEAVYVDRTADRAQLEEKRMLLEKRLRHLTDRADHYFDAK